MGGVRVHGQFLVYLVDALGYFFLISCGISLDRHQYGWALAAVFLAVVALSLAPALKRDFTKEPMP